MDGETNTRRCWDRGEYFTGFTSSVVKNSGMLAEGASSHVEAGTGLVAIVLVRRGRNKSPPEAETWGAGE